MNWRRGAFRLWIVASIIWIGGTGTVCLLSLPSTSVFYYDWSADKLYTGTQPDTLIVLAKIRSDGQTALSRSSRVFRMPLEPIELLTVRQRRAFDERLQRCFAVAVLSRVCSLGVVPFHPRIDVEL